MTTFVTRPVNSEEWVAFPLNESHTARGESEAEALRNLANRMDGGG